LTWASPQLQPRRCFRHLLLSQDTCPCLPPELLLLPPLSEVLLLRELLPPLLLPQLEEDCLQPLLLLLQHQHFSRHCLICSGVHLLC